MFTSSVHPFPIIKAFHASWVVRISSVERHTCDRSRSVVINRSSHPNGCVTRLHRAVLSPCEAPRRPPIDQMTVPVLAVVASVVRSGRLSGKVR